jgi:C4-dicarboxylate-specific signal transduction histidine kinase
MNRLGMMGELSASLAHEIKQPIAAARNNARAAMNFLDMQPPTWTRSGKHSTASSGMSIVLEISSMGSAIRSRKRLRE